MGRMLLCEVAARLRRWCESSEWILGYRLDSRLVEKGDLFFALSGMKTDGHDHLEEASQKGAVAACVQATYQGPDFGLFLIRVDDVKEALRELAKMSLERKRPFIVGVTGSLGKTMAKEFIAKLLEAKYSVCKNLGSYNSQVTFPLTILNRGDEEVLVSEMGMSIPGEMERLVEVAAPDLAVLTKVALVHAEFFPGGLEQIAEEKKKIFSHPRTKIAILPSTMSIENFSGQICFFSTQQPQAEFFLSISGGKGLIDEKGVRAYSFDLPFKEPHLLYNCFIAIVVARQMHLSWEEIDQQLSKLKLPKMRFEQFERGGIHFINDAYNAAPESVRAALFSLPEAKPGGKRIAVLGDMRELGPFSKESHEQTGHFAQQFVDHVLSFGSDSSLLSKAFAESQKPGEHFSNLKDLASRLHELMKPGDVVLVKGSRSLRLETLFPMIFSLEERG